MGRTVGPISYNLADNGRVATGKGRNWDIASAVRVINSPAVQEAVKSGDMLGYYGHLPRTLFNTMRPVEGGIVNGKYTPIEHAVRTLSLTAAADGTVTHTTEFLDTLPGEMAERADRNKVGGFSSFMTAVPRTSPSIANGYYGQDYVAEPNYTQNRSYRVLDGVDGAEGEELDLAVLDSVIEFAQASGAAGEMAAQILGDVMPQYVQALETLTRLERENAVMMDKLAKAGFGRAAVLDSVEFVSVPRVNYVQANLDDVRRFSSARLAVFDSATDMPVAPAEAELMRRVNARVRSGGGR